MNSIKEFKELFDFIKSLDWLLALIVSFIWWLKRLLIKTNKSFKFDVVTVNEKGAIIKRRKFKARYFTETLNGGISLDMISIPGGNFLMGSEKCEGYEDEEPQHEVKINPFHLGRYPITKEQWDAVAALPKISRNLSTGVKKFECCNHPMVNISWYDAKEFCDRLSDSSKGKTAGKKYRYRLPSEAEWEYACRAGTTTPFYFGKTITRDLVNYSEMADYPDDKNGLDIDINPVSPTYPNPFGLCDMHGNVGEWCSDVWHKNYIKAPKDGSSWNSSSEEQPPRVWRGGSFINQAKYCRSASRGIRDPNNAGEFLGFRVVCEDAGSSTSSDEAKGNTADKLQTK